MEYKEDNDEQKVIAIIILFPVTGKKYSSLKMRAHSEKGGGARTTPVEVKKYIAVTIKSISNS